MTTDSRTQRPTVSQAAPASELPSIRAGAASVLAVRRRFWGFLWGVCSLLGLHTPSFLQAHHGRDFILVQDSAVPAPLTGVVISGFEATREGGDTTFSSESGFYIGLAPSLAFGLMTGFSDERGSWNYTGVTPQFIVSVLPPTGPLNFRMGLWTGYEFAEEQVAADSLAGHSHPGSGGSGPDAGPVTPHSHGQHDHGSHSHGGIHRHGESGLYSRLIFEADLSEKTRLVLNLVSFVSGSGSGPGFGYASGVRHELNHDLSLGLEAIGDFESYGSSHEVLFTAMIGLPGHVSLRLGVGGGLTRSSPDLTLHTGLLWRF